MVIWYIPFMVLLDMIIKGRWKIGHSNKVCQRLISRTMDPFLQSGVLMIAELDLIADPGIRGSSKVMSTQWSNALLPSNPYLLSKPGKMQSSCKTRRKAAVALSLLPGSAVFSPDADSSFCPRLRVWSSNNWFGKVGRN